MVFLKEFFEKVKFEKNQQTTKKTCRQRVQPQMEATLVKKGNGPAHFRQWGCHFAHQKIMKLTYSNACFIIFIFYPFYTWDS